MKWIALLFALVSCSKESPSGDVISAKTKSALIKRQNAVRLWAETKDGVAAKGGSVGDATLFNGLLCFSGEKWACDNVANAQGANGRFWRAPSRVENDTPATFSRDMSLGVMAYIAKTKDYNRGNLWFRYISDIGRYCPDSDSCDFRNTEGLLKRVLKIPYLGGDDALDSSTANSVDPGFPRHLLMTKVLIRQEIKAYSGVLAGMARLISNKEPKNIYFDYIYNGPSEKQAKYLLSSFPENKPEKTNQWAFERTDSEEAFKSSCGWDQVFFINLLLK